MHSLNVIPKLLLKVEEFISSNIGKKVCSNAWIETHPLKVYVRIANHIIDSNKIERVLDIASIKVKPKWQKKGIGTSAIEAIHLINPLYATRIESVMSEHLNRYLIRNNWNPIRYTNVSSECQKAISASKLQILCENYYKLKE